MHPDQHFTPGTRVRVLRTRYGWEAIHNGRTGTVLRSASPSGFYPAYVVEMDAPRREQVIALALETLPAEATVKPGDRVKVTRTGANGFGELIDGKLATVRAVNIGTRKAIEVETEAPWQGSTRRAWVEAVEKVESLPHYDEATASVGDDVVVLRQPRAEKITRNYEGEVGTVERVDEPYKVGDEISHRYYRVRLKDGTVVKATKVSPLPASLRPKRDLIEGVDPTEKAEQEAAEAAAADVPILVDLKRVQAIKVAQEILGEFPDVDELIKLASFIEGTVTTAAAGADLTDVEVPLTLVDGDGDTITFNQALTEPGASTIVTTDMDAAGVYITDDDVERIVTFLRAQRDR